MVAGRKFATTLLIFALIIGASGIWIREVALSQNYLTKHLGQVEIIGTVKSDLTPKGTFLLNTESVNGRRIHLPVRIYLRAKRNIVVDQKLRIIGEAVQSREKRSAALVFASNIEKLREPKPLFAISETIRKNFRESSARIGGDAGALIPGLVIGDTSNETLVFAGEMKRVGLTHLTAVSGENFAIVASFIGWFLSLIIPKLKVRLVITAIFLVLFVFLVRPSPSVIRAGAMAAISLLSLGKGIRVPPLASLGAAVGLILLIDPWQSIDPGFALSVGATAGIILLAPKLKLPQTIAIPVAATIFCTPVIIALSGTLSLVSIPANLLVSPLVAPITVIGFVAALIPQLGYPLILLISPLVKIMVGIAHFGANIPVLQTPKSFLGATLILLIIAIVRFRRNFAIILLLLATILFYAIHSSFPGRNWEIVNCNVGQGDAMVINLGGSNAILIDTGPDPVLVDKCLKSLNIKEIPLMVLTHFHMDHVGGLSGAIKNRKIGQVWLTNFDQPLAEYEIVSKELSAVKQIYPIRGYQTEFNSPKGKVIIKVLWPIPATSESLGHDGTTINNSSLVLLLTINNLRILATGDIEPLSASEIYLDNTFGKVDVLKVAHHGSAYQYPPFIERAHPKLALISVGLGNKYGHPAPDTIALLNKIGAKVYRTDLDGAISVDSSLSIRTKKKDWWDISWG